MKMKLTALSMAIAAAGLAATAAQANDVAMFPYVVSSPTVTTIVSIVDTGSASTERYTASRVGATPGDHLHWRLNYKAGANATNNTAVCGELNRWLPTSPGDIQTVDLGGRFGANSAGVLFNDPSVNNNWQANTTGGNTYMLAKDAGSPVRGVLYVHNADTVSGTQTVYGEAMILEFGSGAAWGYQSINIDGSFTVPSTEAVASGPAAPLTIMPPAQVTTRLFVTPVATNGVMLGTDGASIANWNTWTTRVDLAINGTSEMYNRDERPFSGGPEVDVTCVGAVDVADLMGANANSTMANGGWSRVRLQNPTGLTGGRAATNRAFITKLEFSTGQSFNGEGSFGTFNNGFIMR